jgi:hypothetical protein
MTTSSRLINNNGLTWSLLDLQNLQLPRLGTVLGRHPEIQISRSMEPKFFGRNNRRGWEWYGQQFSGEKRHRLLGGSKHDVQLFLPLMSRHTTSHPPPSRHHSPDLSRSSSLTTHWIPLKTLARWIKWLPSLSPTPGVKSSQAASGRGISLPPTTHAVTPIVSCWVNPLPHRRRAKRKSCQEPEYQF